MIRLTTNTNNSSTQYRIYLQEVKMMPNGITVNELTTASQENEDSCQ